MKHVTSIQYDRVIDAIVFRKNDGTRNYNFSPKAYQFSRLDTLTHVFHVTVAEGAVFISNKPKPLACRL